MTKTVFFNKRVVRWGVVALFGMVFWCVCGDFVKSKWTNFMGQEIAEIALLKEEVAEYQTVMTEHLETQTKGLKMRTTNLEMRTIDVETQTRGLGGMEARIRDLEVLTGYLDMRIMSVEEQLRMETAQMIQQANQGVVEVVKDYTEIEEQDEVFMDSGDHRLPVDMLLMPREE